MFFFTLLKVTMIFLKSGKNFHTPMQCIGKIMKDLISVLLFKGGKAFPTPMPCMGQRLGHPYILSSPHKSRAPGTKSPLSLA